MSKFKNIFRIESTRLNNWDYSSPWWYYVTINTKNHVEYFGKIENEKMILNELGKIADKYWLEIPNHFSIVELDYYVVMPNHIHGIIIINESGNNICRDVACNVSTDNIFSQISPKGNSLSTIIRSYKSAVSKNIHELYKLDFSWQTRFYDRIIRNEKELFNIRKYIEQNPLKWELDKDKPENIFEF
ncbi:MAG: hypothetical protein N2321_10940 [Melioribacteraceae bacterium]|nr:hypothetical protein [Melioribacteraceae bacterium]